MFSWMRKNLPPFVTTSPAGTAQTAAGVLGQPNTSVLFGNANVNGDFRSGVRLEAGGWFDANRTIGVDVGFFMLESQNALFFATSQGNPILARPFTDATTGNPSSQLVAFPGLDTGSIVGSDRSNNLYSVNVDFLEVAFERPGFRLEGLFGYRFLRFDDALNINQNLVATGTIGAIVPGTQIQPNDSFSAQNEFNGGEFGLRAEWHRQRWSVDLLAKLAAGDLDRDIAINGSTRISVPGSPATTLPGGFLALSSNIGSHNSEDFIVVPEFGTTLGWDITNSLRLRLGYSLLFLSEMANAADQVSLNINPNLFPTSASTGTTPSSPSFSLHTSYLWIQSINLGLEFRY